MTSIDDLFKSAGVSKRKLDPLRDPNEIYKSAKTSSSAPSRHAQVAEDDDAEAGPAPPPEDDDGEYGPSAPPADDEEPEEAGDDEEGGRFFGGGITKDQAEVLTYVNNTNAGADGPAKYDAAWLRRTALHFEKTINKNAELRARYADQPARFMESEADLDAGVRGWAVLAEHGELWGEWVRVGSAASLVGLLAHENADIAVAVVEVIGELTGEDVEAAGEEWDVLVDALLEADLLGLLVGTFGRLDERDEADREGVYHAMEVVENLCSRPETADAVGRNAGMLKWLLARATKSEKVVGQNKQYAAEILAILLQASAANRRRLAELDAADVLLQCVASYRKRDPEKGGEEEEFMENLFEALTCLVDEPEGKAKFVDAEGVELCLIMLKEGKMSKRPSLRLLDHAVGGAAGTQVSQKVVEEGGLKTLFTMFMKKHDHQTTEHLLGIFNWMLRLLPANSAERIRTLAKFVEKDYEKTAKLAKLRREYLAKAEAAEHQLREEFGGKGPEGEDEEEEWLSRRMEAGLFCLQTINVILAWLVAEDDGARKKIEALLAEHDETFRDLKVRIEEQLKETDGETPEGKETRDILSTLMDFLQ
ncbi:Catenin-beta-like protein [Coniochaeta sp. 2T2.1]|nr:Catenin-beta-like protein [Coniochaeta sp. 2T2.1]